MSITDELRRVAAKTECANGRCEKLYRGDLDHIADRIDAEHERECKEQYAIGAEHGIGASIDASMIQTHGYIELPKDADGVPIHVGDVLTDGEYTFRVDELAAFGDGSWSIRNEDGNAWAACDVTHYHAPTVEDVLRDMHMKLDEVTALYVGEAIDSDERDRDEARIFAECAQRLQLREVDE